MMYVVTLSFQYQMFLPLNLSVLVIHPIAWGQNYKPVKKVEKKKSLSVESDIPEFIKKFDKKQSN